MPGTEHGFRDLAHRLHSDRPHRQSSRSTPLPSRPAVVGLVNQATRLLFPDRSADSPYRSRAELEQALVLFHQELWPQVLSALHFDSSEGDDSLRPKAQETSRAFVEKFPSIQTLLESDVQAAYDGDPALSSVEEAILCYPGVAALACFRLAHELCALQVPLIPRMMSEHAHSTTGIDINPGAQIGEKFFIDHGTGVVIGETAVIGNRVRLYQGVTLGAKSFPSDQDGKLRKGLARHPILEDDVVVYSWASILGRITIGRGSIIGGNVWVTRDVPAGSIVTQAQSKQTGFSDGAGI